MSLRRRDALHVWDLHFGPNMTPMVDVVMVILIFFMAGSAFVGPEFFLRAALPARGGGPAARADPFALPPARFDVTLSPNASGHTIVDGLGLAGASLSAAEERIAALAREVDPEQAIVVISPDAGVRYEDVVAVHDACVRAGLVRVGLTSR